MAPVIAVESSLCNRIGKFLQAVFVGESLKAKTLRGGMWLGAGSFSEQAIRFGRNIVLARLIAPEAFGTMAIVLSVGTMVQTILDVGVKEALIQNPRGSEDQYVDAAWWLSFGRSVLLCVTVLSISPWIARFYENPQLTPLFRVSAISLLFQGALSARAYMALRRLEFRNWAIIIHGGGGFGVIASVVLSFMVRDVWALVIGNGLEIVGRFLLSYVFYPYLPTPRLPVAAMRDLLKFSRNVFGLALLNLVFARTDIFVSAKIFSPVELGLYTMAIYVVQAPTGFIMSSLGAAFLPTYSRIQKDEARTTRVLIRMTSVLLLIGMPVIVFISFCGRSLLTLLYGLPYAAATGPLVGIAFVSLFNVINGQVTMVFFARGFPQLHRSCVLIAAVTMIVLIYPFLIRFGLLGGQLAALIAISAGFLFQLFRLPGLIKLDLFEYFRVVGLFAAVSLVAALSCFGIAVISDVSQPMPNILVGIVACLVAWGAGLLVFFRRNPHTTA